MIAIPRLRRPLESRILTSGEDKQIVKAVRTIETKDEWQGDPAVLVPPLPKKISQAKTCTDKQLIKKKKET
jgi:hypothetical protein